MLAAHVLQNVWSVEIARYSGSSEKGTRNATKCELREQSNSISTDNETDKQRLDRSRAQLWVRKGQGSWTARLSNELPKTEG